MQYLGRHYVLYINRQYGRTLWEGRYKASLVQEEDCLLACYRNIEPNSVRVEKAKDPGHIVGRAMDTTRWGKLMR